MSPCFSFLIENKTKNPGIPLVYPISKWDNYNIHVFYLRVHQQGSSAFRTKTLLCVVVSEFQWETI